MINKKQIVLVISFMGILLLCMSFSSWAMVEERKEWNFDLNKDGSVEVKNVSGDIRISSWEQDSVKLIARKVAGNQKDLETIKIEIDSSKNKLKIKTRINNGPRLFRWTSNLTVHYEIFIPRETSVEIDSVSGDVRVNGVGGSFNGDVISGDVEVNGVKGPVDIDSKSGNIEIAGAENGVECDTVSGNMSLTDISGKADLETVSGSIRINRLKGSVNAETVSGNIILLGIEDAQRVKTESVSGDVTFKGKVTDYGKYELSAHSGDIRIEVPEGSGFRVEAETFSGEINIEFDIRMSGKMNTRKIIGRVGDGSCEFELSTFSGDIVINKR